MFSLIIVIVSVALVVAVVAATLYHGGDTVTEGSRHAQSAQILNEGSQLRGALVLYQANTGAEATSVTDLVTSKTLTTALPGWEIIDGYAYRSVDNRDVCLAANEKVGVHTVPACSDATYAGTAVCCSQDA